MRGEPLSSDSVLKGEAKGVGVKLEMVSGLNPVTSCLADPVYPVSSLTEAFIYTHCLY